MSKTIVITGASSGLGASTARALADAGHTVYAGMCGTTAAMRAYATEHGVNLCPIELDVSDQASVDDAIAHVVATSGGIDAVVHNAGHVGPTAEQSASVHRAVLPHLRAQRDGLVVWVGSTRGRTSPYLAPYVVGKAAESLAVGYAAELTGFDVDTTILVAASFTRRTSPADMHAGLMEQVRTELAPPDAPPGRGCPLDRARRRPRGGRRPANRERERL
ncbi:SDR family NAD(P)-dependent oxidoreductase [Kibdelosporangium philippinense]|uniref:SDR family NAD(P)-dependent oxidoreductase n=1 Tax=Kibdelosporangium philippinense TaxID=211113 RepID=A0ABS8Z5G0_9PSEU|nr:SDR family NAD(P)-dependent oxidoreductase [Kibdelosporangium philippinense]MCE7002278.1 SDR family NAD(P)-dependent oxidoreductase [Kibdelosporangium philippinense]